MSNWTVERAIVVVILVIALLLAFWGFIEIVDEIDDDDPGLISLEWLAP